jgi:hypothetical protein
MPTDGWAVKSEPATVEVLSSMDTTQARETHARKTHARNQTQPEGTPRARASGIRVAAKSFAATALACAGFALFAVPAFAHANAVTGTATCATGGGFAITWTVANDFKLSEVATVTSATGGVSTVSGSPAQIAGSNGQPFKTATMTQALPASTTGPATLTVNGVWSDNFSTSNSGSTSLPSGCTPPTQTLAGHIYLCPGGNSQTTTEVPGGTLAATGPQTVAPVPNPLQPTPVAAGQYTTSATPPSGYQLVVCGGSSSVPAGGHSATETVSVPVGGTGNGIFYVTNVPPPAVSGAGGAAPTAAQTPPPAPATAAAGSAVQGATTVNTGEPWAGSGPFVAAVAALGAGMLGAGFWLRRRRRTAASG